ncbi:MAG: glycosyltransferase [Methylovirgula sp.]
MELLLSCIWAAVVGALIVRAARQRHLLALVEPVSTPAVAPNLAVIVPARNEEGNIAPCLVRLIAQTYPPERLRILVVDDHSADSTLAIATSIAARHRQVRVLKTPPLPAHWIGKSHACWIGSRAVPPDSEWLCFFDADMRAEPGLLASAVACADRENLDLLSLAARHELKSFAERLVLPCGLYFLSFCQDLKRLQADDCADTTVTGQFMLIRRSAYERVGGHAAISAAICEDVALARLLKRNGRVLLGDGSRLLATRMYTGWASLWPGLAKNLVEMLGGARATLTTALIIIALAWAAWLLPLADALGCARQVPGSCVALVPALLGSGAALGFHLGGAVYFRIPFWYAFLFPLGYTAGAAMAIDSIRRRLRRKVTWKGRTYP